VDNSQCSRSNPCRTFAAAIAAVNANGEVVVLNSAGYGPVTIDKAVTIVAPAAVHAAIAPTAGTAITVNAPGSTVILKGLYLNSLGATEGVSVDSAAVVHIENLVVNGFGTPCTTSGCAIPAHWRRCARLSRTRSLQMGLAALVPSSAGVF
jgi:hypothetical protein